MKHNKLESGNSRRQVIQRVVSILFYVLIAVFVYFYLQTVDFSQLQNLTIAWEFLAIAIVSGLSSRFYGSYIWFTLLKNLGAKGLAWPSELTYVYAKAWLGRYIPGTAPWILGRIYFASQHGVSKNKLAVSSVLEGGLKIAAMISLALIWLAIDWRLDSVGSEYKLGMLVILAGCVIALLPPVFNRVMSLAYKLVRKKTLEKHDQASNKTVARGALMYTLGAFVDGLSLFFIAMAVYPELGFGSMLFVMGVGNLAGALSMLAVFAPGGIGVREGIQLALLSFVMPPEFALVVTVATRLWIVAVDFMFFGLSKLVTTLTLTARR